MKSGMKDENIKMDSEINNGTAAAASILILLKHTEIASPTGKAR
jgi:hypothetical protein